MEESGIAAPYWRFRPTWSDYYADIMECAWTCKGCWSKYGWHTVPANFSLYPDEVVERVAQGMEVYTLPRLRLSGGEPGLYWDGHVMPLIERFLQRTDKTIWVETNGAHLTFDQIDRLEQFAADHDRVKVVVGLKSTTAEGLSELTGMEPEEAEETHERQLTNLLYLAHTDHVGVRCVLLNRYTDLGMVAAIGRHVADLKIERLRPYGNANRYYTPERFRRPKEGAVNG